jgi:hypothetical protein
MLQQSLQAGWQMVRANKRMVAVFYLANLFFGLLLMWPLRVMLKDFIGDSMMGSKLGGTLDMDFLFEFIKHNEQAGSVFFGLVFIIPAVAWLFTLFLSGGALAVFAQGQKYEPALFWGGAAKYFGRFCRLALWSLPVFAALFCLQYLESGAQRLFFGKDPYENIIYWGGWIKAGLRVLSFLLFGMILDYARIHAVLTDENTMRLSLRSGLGLISKNFLSTFGLAFLLFVVGGLALAIYNPLADSLAAPNGLIILLLFLLQQFYMLFRATLRLILYASQLHLYRALESAPAAAKITSAETMDMNGLTPAAE